MTAELAAHPSMTEEEYLAWEAGRPEKHEYIGGVVYAMAGGKNRHNLIASNMQGALYAQLRGKRCRVYNSDTKVKVLLPTHTRFYYPDAMVVCRASAPDLTYQEEPVVLVEVVSASTRRTDELEKREAYQMIPALRVYVVLEKDLAAATVWRRGSKGFVREVYSGMEATIPLPEIEAMLPLAEVYDAVAFTAVESAE